MMPRACKDCGVVQVNGTRCRDCTRTFYSLRNARHPYRWGYIDPAYRSFVPSGPCHWCGVRPATERDHVIPLREGGTNDPSNLVGACSECNQARRKLGKRAPKEVGRFCVHGHDKDVVGREPDGGCRACAREQGRERQRAARRAAGIPERDSRFCKRGHDTEVVGRNTQRACRQCERDASRERKRAAQVAS